MKLVKQCDSTFVRHYDDIGYVYNRLTRRDRVYDDWGSAFLSLLSRTPRRLDDLVVELGRNALAGRSREEISAALESFVSELADEGYVVFGDNDAEIAAREPRFSYAAPEHRMHFSTRPEDGYDDTSDFFFDYFQRQPSIFRIQIDLTSRCNERCVHCYLPPGREMVDLDTAVVIDVLDQLVDFRTLSVTFSGGEPFLHRDLERLLRKARENDFAITILSNGTRVSERMVDVLHEVQVDEVQFSLFSLDPEKHERITGIRGSHAKTMSAINRLMAAEIPVQLSCPVLRTNVDSYKDVVRWAHARRLKVSTDFILMACTNFSTANIVENRLSLKEVEGLIREMLQYDREYITYLNGDERPIDPATLQGKPVCGAARDTICLAADGTYYFCPLFRKPLGSAKTDRLRDIWDRSKPVQALREITWSSFPECGTCDAFHFCSMCFARNFNENEGDILRINRHCCDVAHMNRDLVNEYWAKNGHPTLLQRTERTASDHSSTSTEGG